MTCYRLKQIIVLLNIIFLFLGSSSKKSNNFDLSNISFELIDKCIRDLKFGKASGPDELMAEHLKYAHPILIYHLCILFRAISVHLFQMILASALLSP